MATALEIQPAPIARPTRPVLRSLLSPLVFDQVSAAARLGGMEAVLQAIRVVPLNNMLRVTGSFSRGYDVLDGIVHYRDGHPRFDFYMMGLANIMQPGLRETGMHTPIYAIGTARPRGSHLAGVYHPHSTLRWSVLDNSEHFARALYVVSSQLRKDECQTIFFGETAEKLPPPPKVERPYFRRE